MHLAFGEWMDFCEHGSMLCGAEETVTIPWDDIKDLLSLKYLAVVRR